MKNFKKALALVLIVAIAMTAGIMGTLAYLTSEDSDVNVMTMGFVSIKQHEYEREQNADGSYTTIDVAGTNSYKLVPFTQGKPLLPAVGNPNGGYDSTEVRLAQLGHNSRGGMQVLPIANVQDKFVVVENDGITDAYVRTIVAIEAGDLTYEEAYTYIKYSFHFTRAESWVSELVEIDGNKFYVVEFLYKGYQDIQHPNGVLKAGDYAYNSLAQVYLTSAATNEICQKVDGNGNGTLDILVLSQAVQAAGFADAATALNTAFGATDATNAAAWFGAENIPVIVTSCADMRAALEAGEKDIIVKGVTVSENPFNGHYYKETDVDFVDCTFTTNMNWMYINNATFTNCTFDCGSANAAVHYDQLFGDAVFTNCTFVSGKIQIGTAGDATVTFNECVFGETTSTSIWSEKGMRVYCPAVFNKCEFNNRVVVAGSADLPLTFNSCTMNGGAPVYYVDNTDGIIRGGNVPSVTINN